MNGKINKLCTAHCWCEVPNKAHLLSGMKINQHWLSSIEKLWKQWDYASHKSSCKVMNNLDPTSRLREMASSGILKKRTWFPDFVCLTLAKLLLSRWCVLLNCSSRPRQIVKNTLLQVITFLNLDYWFLHQTICALTVFYQRFQLHAMQISEALKMINLLPGVPMIFMNPCSNKGLCRNIGQGWTNKGSSEPLV